MQKQLKLLLMDINLRVLFLDTRPIRRGAQVFVHDLKQCFSDAGFPVKRIFLYKEKNFENLLLDENDVIMPFREDHYFEKIPSVHPLLVRRLAKEISSFAPDIILCNGSRTLKYAAVVKYCYQGIKSKWVYRVIDSAVYWNSHSFKKFYYRHLVIPAMDGAVGVSKKSLNEMINHYIFKKPSVCIPRAIDVDYFSNYIQNDNSRDKIGIKADSFVLLFLGNFTKQKRPDRFLDIVYELQKKISNVHGLMVGDGPLRGQVNSQISRLGITENITLAGYQMDVRPWIAMSNVLLLTSDTEGMPGVILEAAAMKRLTVSNIVGGVQEFISNCDNGFLNFSNTNDEYTKILISIVFDKINIPKLENKCFDTVLQNYHIDSIFRSYILFFNQCINHKQFN
jgi:glycosyltransferase involved in cell wall biosynthesis